MRKHWNFFAGRCELLDARRRGVRFQRTPRGAEPPRGAQRPGGAMLRATGFVYQYMFFIIDFERFYAH